MLKFRSKLLLSVFFAATVSAAIMSTALAGVSVSGSGQVYPGKTYTYTVTVTATGSSIMGTATTSGVLGTQTKTWSKDSSTGLNQSLTATTTITVTIPASAAIGSTGKITVSGQGSKYYPDTGTFEKFYINGSKTITVVAPPTPPPPTAWELAIRDINKVEEGGSITVEMNPEDAKEINVPLDAFEAIKERKIVLSIDYGSFICTIDGSMVGDIPQDGADINVGVTLQPAERADDMLVFDLNNASRQFFVATYSLEPFLQLPEGLIYVYRSYTDMGLLEYVNAAGTDESGNVLVKVFAAGRYIVSAASIDGAEGNMDEQTFIELFATPTPEPTTEPTATPMPTPTATPEPEAKSAQSSMVYILGAILVVLIGALVFVIMKSRKNID